MKNKIELLAPAGNLDICKAVINAGADAVYLGGKSFSARAYAGNLSTDEVIQAIEYAHLRGAFIYLTLNTLLKENETDKVIPFLTPLYEAGLDGVIVQDYGCMKLIREVFPDLNVHASTQMAVMTGYFAGKLKNMGIKRVVLPREMTLDEIKSIYDKTGLELEVFIHGALCYSYSGLCLFSSMHGSRSGNRGSCAQPCRLKFTSYDKTERLLCTKDIAGLRLIPDLIEAGAASLKIEGRMKNVYYAAGVTHIYRKYIDKYYSCGAGAFSSKEINEDIEKLAALYNRGLFSEGLLKGDKGKILMSLDRPNNRGVAALKTETNVKGHCSFRALLKINPGDVFEISPGNSFTSGKSLSPGDIMEVDLPVRHILKKGDLLYRMNDARLQSFIDEEFISKNKKISVDMDLVLKTGEASLLKLVHKQSGCSTEVRGEEVQKARNQGADEEELKKRMLKLGGTDFVCESLNIKADKGIFISNGGLNELRRRGLTDLTDKVLSLSKKNKNTGKLKKSNFLFANSGKNVIISGCMPEGVSFSVLVNTADQLRAVAGSEGVERVYVSIPVLREYSDLNTFEGYASLNNLLSGSQKKFYAAMPHFFRERHICLCEEDMELALKFEPEGFLIRSLDQLAALESYLVKTDRVRPYKIVTDYQVYAYNSLSADFICNLVRTAGFVPEVFTAPVELTGREMSDIRYPDDIGTEAVCYGRMVLMVSEHCVAKTMDRCRKEGRPMAITGEKGDKYLVSPDCRYCNNVIYDSVPLDLLNEFKDSSIRRYRLEFTDETMQETDMVLKHLTGDTSADDPGGKKARFYTGII